MTNKLCVLILIFCTILVNNTYSQSYGTSNYFDIHHSVGLSNFENNSLLNPASITNDSINYLIFRVKPSKFGINELNSMLLASKLKLDNNFDLAIIFNGLGGDLYSEFGNETILSFKLNNFITLGASFEINHLKIKNYSNQNLVFLNFGSTIRIADNLYTGFALRNIFRNYTANFDKTIFQESILGISYLLDENLIFDLDAVIIINSYSAFNFAVNYCFDENIRARFAVRTNPIFYEVASQFNLFNNFYIMIGASYNPIFGINPEISIKYDI